MKSVLLHSSSLFSKFGFCDGDILDDWRYEVGDDMIRGLKAKQGSRADFLGFEHALLSRLVRKHLLPALPRTVEIYDICSIHNPIRAEDGEAEDFDVVVEVGYDQITAEAADLIATSMEPV